MMATDATKSDTPCDTHKVLIATATYNEIDNLPDLIEAMRGLLPSADVLVVDDNSPDGTGQWLRRRSKVDSHVKGIHRDGKLGLGSATVAAMQYAIEHEYELLVTLDADWSHHPSYIPQLVSAMQEHPQAVVAIGSRYVAGGAIDGWPAVRRLMSHAMNAYARCLLGLSARDCTGAFRCYRVDALRQVRWETCRADGYAFLEEILWRLADSHRTLVEIPIVFTDRQRGQTKLGWGEAVRSVATLASLRWRGKGGHVEQSAPTR